VSTDFVVAGEPYRVADRQREDGYPVTARRSEYEYEVRLMHNGQVVGGWDSWCEELSARHLTLKEARRAVRMIMEDVAAGRVSLWFRVPRSSRRRCERRA